MARYSAGVRTAAGSTTLPIASPYAAAGVSPKLRECGMFNTTTTAVAEKLQRLTTTGTQGTSQTEAKYDPDTAVSGGDFRTTHTVAPTLGDDLGYRVPLGAAVGVGVIFIMVDIGIIIPLGTMQGIGVIVVIGIGQIADVYMVWDE